MLKDQEDLSIFSVLQLCFASRCPKVDHITMVREGAAVIDVGINYVRDNHRKDK